MRQGQPFRAKSWSAGVRFAREIARVVLGLIEGLETITPPCQNDVRGIRGRNVFGALIAEL